MAANSTDVPEGYVLVKKSDLDGLKSLGAVISSLNKEISECKSDVERIQSNRVAYNKNIQDNKAGLVAKFDDICRNSNLRSDIETVRSQCINKLKHKVSDLHKKQAKSTRDLKKRFQEGSSELNKAYKNELVRNFQSKSSSDEPGLEQYACDELLKTYRECLERQLIPKMDHLYRGHCQKMDQALKDFITQYSRSVGGEAEVSPAIRQKLMEISQKLDRMKHNSVTRQKNLNETVNRVTHHMSQLRVEPRMPVPRSPEEEIQECIENGDYHEALNKALVAINVDLLLDTLPKLNVDDVFGDNPPSQPLILALLSQLPNDLHVKLELKAEFLSEAIQAIDLDHEIIKAHKDSVVTLLSLLLDHIDKAKEEITPREYLRNLKNLRWASQQIIARVSQW